MNYDFFQFHKSHPGSKHHHHLHRYLKIRCQNEHNTMAEEKLTVNTVANWTSPETYQCVSCYMGIKHSIRI